MKTNKILIAATLAVLSPMALAGEKVIDGDRDCSTLTVNGGFFKGKTYKSSSFVADVTTADAIKRASQSLVADGWKIASTDEKLGIISADTTVSYGSGKTSPLGVTFVDKDGGLAVNITYSISGATAASSKDIAKQFCSIVDAVEGK